MKIITDLDTLCLNCGFFDSKSPVNNGYGCSHKRCSEGDFLDSKGNHVHRVDVKIAISLTNRNIKCNKRLSKKFLKKARKMSFSKQKEQLEKIGIRYYGKCFSYSCPISNEVSFDSLSNYKNCKDYDYIKNEDQMPYGFGDELMGLDIKAAKRIGII